MRARRIVHATFAALGLLALAGTSSAQLDSKFDPTRLTATPLRRVPEVHPERLKLANGIVVFLLENHELPVVTGTVYARATPLWIPANRAGLARLAGEVIRSGGSAEHTGDWLDDRLAAIGASVTSGIDDDLASGGFRCLSDNTTEVIGLLAEILQKPAFPEDKIELSKVSLRRDIASRNDEMTSVLQRLSGQAVYGKDSPYAREPEYATVEPITREDCVALHRKVFEPARTVVAVYGDFKSEGMKKLLAARFGSWKGAGVAVPPTPPPPELSAARLMFAPKDDVTQSGIVLTHVGFRADDPDAPALDVMRTALGGGFQSRLVNRIRTERGLAYSTGANAGQGYQRPGVFFAYSLTKSESTMVALDLLREEVRKITEAPLTDEELRLAKESVQNQFVFNFEEPSQVLFRSAFFEVAGYPQDFLQRYQLALEAVTAQSVLAAAKRKLHPESAIVVLVGKEKDFDRPLDSAGLAVSRMDITIPGPASKVSVGNASPEALSQGRTWLQKAADLSGGTAAWQGIKSVATEQQQTVSFQGQSVAVNIAVSWLLPDRWIVVQKLPMGEVKRGFDGKDGWMSAMGQIQDQPGAAEELSEEYERSLFHLFGHPDDVALQALPEPRTVDGVAYQVGYLKSDRVKDWTVFFSPDGRLARMEYQGKSPMGGPAVVTEVFRDWNAEGPVQMPHAMQILIDGKPFADGKLTAAKINPPLDAAAFKKPSP